MGNSGISKHRFNGSNDYNVKGGESLIYVGRVISNTDEYDGARIKVRIDGLDDSSSDDELPFASPLLVKFFSIVPSVGETVLIFKTKTDVDFENRLYMGPIISQPQMLGHDPYFYSSTSTMDGGVVEPQVAPSSVAKAKGVYPNKKYVSIQGRENNDITFKTNEIQIRNGKHKPNDKLTFNDKISYIKIKNNISITENTVGGVTNIVSSKINLLSHGGKGGFKLLDRDELITDSEMKKILDDASPMVYGDKLVELLELFKEFVNGHTHAYAGLPPVKDKKTIELLNKNLNDILSTNIKIS